MSHFVKIVKFKTGFRHFSGPLSQWTPTRKREYFSILLLGDNSGFVNMLEHDMNSAALGIGRHMFSNVILFTVLFPAVETYFVLFLYNFQHQAKNPKCDEQIWESITCRKRNITKVFKGIAKSCSSIFMIRVLQISAYFNASFNLTLFSLGWLKDEF